MLSQQLKELTKHNHLLIERKLVASIKSIRSKEEYATLLAMFFSYFGGLQLAADNHITAAFLPDYLQRRKTSALANDLAALNAPMPAFATKNNLPVINNQLQSLGALYVMEGSALGGKIIGTMIRQQLNLPNLKAFNFFDGYGDDTISMWQTFKQFIDGLLLTPGQQATVIETANDTFLKFSQWFDGRQL